MPGARFTFCFITIVLLAFSCLVDGDCAVQLSALSQQCDLQHWRDHNLDGSIKHLLPRCCEALEETFDLLEGESESCICHLLHRNALEFEFSPIDTTTLISVCPSQSKPKCLFTADPKDKLSFKDKCYFVAAAVGMIGALIGCCAAIISCYRDTRKKSAKPSPRTSPLKTPTTSRKMETSSPSSHQGSKSSSTKRHKKSGGTSGGSTGHAQITVGQERGF